MCAPAADFGCPQEDEPKSLQAAGLGDVAEETLNRVLGFRRWDFGFGLKLRGF